MTDRSGNVTFEMPIDADHATGAVADTLPATATDTAGQAGTPVFGSASQKRTATPANVEPGAGPPPPTASGWGGAAVVVVPTLGVLGVVAAIVVVNEVNDWWTLLPAMALVLVATLGVMATIGRMLAGND